MSEINNIYEITRSLSSPDVLKNDLQEIAELAARHFSAKYFAPINAAVASHRDYCASHPCREANLLKALKPFTRNADKIDTLIDAINLLRLFTPQTTVSAAAANESVIHPDGIYELDEGCIRTSSEQRAITDITELDPIIILAVLAFVFLSKN